MLKILLSGEITYLDTQIWIFVLYLMKKQLNFALSQIIFLKNRYLTRVILDNF